MHTTLLSKRINTLKAKTKMHNPFRNSDAGVNIELEIAKIKEEEEATMVKLTEAEFLAVGDTIDAAMRTSKKDTPERVAAQTKRDVWEAAIALPQATWAQREARFAAIAAAATKVQA